MLEVQREPQHSSFGVVRMDKPSRDSYSPANFQEWRASDSIAKEAVLNVLVSLRDETIERDREVK